MRHPVQWAAPAPMWAPGLDSPQGERLRRPTILRFATDDFMEALMRVLETDPARIAEFEAQPETWREPAGAPAAVPALVRSTRERALARLGVAVRRKSAAASPARPLEAAPAEKVLKLYQPAHQRYYLLAAALVCRLPGLPDRTIDPARQERAAFVIRRLREGGEYAFVPGPGGAWTKIVGPANTLVPGEEQLPLFPLNFTDDSARRRRMLAGLIPVARREAYLGAGQAVAPPPAAPLQPSGEAADPGAPPPPVDPRVALFAGLVSEPWKALIAKARKDAEALTESGSSGNTSVMIKESRENVQVASWYVLLDFAEFLRQHLPNVWLALNGAGPALTGPEAALISALQGATLSSSARAQLVLGIPAGKVPSVPLTLSEALVRIGAAAEGLERVTGAYDRNNPASDWPSFIFPLADLKETAPLPQVTIDPAPTEHARRLRRVSGLVKLVTAALPSTAAGPMPPTPLAAQPVLAPGERGLFTMRCVYERPECGPLDPPVVSEPSRTFELAGFFDPDAPARPIRIALPVDTTPAGLRKFDRNTAFVMSDILCGQVARAKGLGFVDLVRSVLPFPFHKDLSVPDNGPCKSDDGLSLGMICSISIPIITICALILLMIIVSLLDIVFRWLPWFVFCFPVPGLKGKESTT